MVASIGKREDLEAIKVSHEACPQAKVASSPSQMAKVIFLFLEQTPTKTLRLHLNTCYEKHKNKQIARIGCHVL